MTKLTALREVLKHPRDVGMDKIGHRVIYAKADGRERITHVVKVLRSVLRRIA